MRKRIALLGCGTVGARVAEVLLRDRDRIAQRTGIELELVRILVRDLNRPRGRGSIPCELFTDRFKHVLDDDQIDLVIELIGGCEDASGFVRDLLGRGVSVVTANKTLIAREGAALWRIAQQSGADLAYDAAVGGAVPILAALRTLIADEIESIEGVLNGTCNFILGEMERTGCALGEAVALAQQCGLAEPDPAADLSGRDAAEKLSVIACEIGLSLKPDEIAVTGIESIIAETIDAARRTGGRIKLVARFARGIATVRPERIARDHPLFNVDGEENALLVRTALAGDNLLRGRGAGPDPTTAAILGDIVRLLRSNHNFRPAQHSCVSRKVGMSLPKFRTAHSLLRA